MVLQTGRVACLLLLRSYPATLMDSMKNLLIYGCGGLGLEILSYVKAVHDDNTPDKPQVTGFIDDDIDSARVEDARAVWPLDYALYEGVENAPAGHAVIIAIGEPQTRAKVFEKSVAAGLVPYTLVHPSAVVSPAANIGAGCILGPFSFVGPIARVGQNCIINNYASVGHDATVGDSSVLSPYSSLNGSASCGERSFLGTASVILVGKALGASSKLSAGSLLNTDTDAGALAIGNPAKWRVMFRA